MSLTWNLLRWSKMSAGRKAAESWILDRSWDLTEGERLLKARDYAAAEGHLSKAAVEAELKKRSGARRIHIRLLLAEAQRKQCQQEESATLRHKLTLAEQTLRSALAIAERNSERELYLHCLDALAEVLADQGDFAAVEKVTQEAVQREAALAHPDQLRMARRVLRLGVARHRLGRTDDAIPVLQKALAMAEQTHGAEHPETARHLAELGAVFRAQGNHDEAQKYLRRSLRIHQRHLGANSPEAVRDLHHLAGSLEEAGDCEGAAEEYERALTFKHRMIGADLTDFADMQYGLARLYIKWQNYARARELLFEAIGTFKRNGGVRLAAALEALAYVEECSGRYEAALKGLAEATKVWESLGAASSEPLLRNLEHRAELLGLLRKKSDAETLRKRAEELRASIGETEAPPGAWTPPDEAHEDVMPLHGQFAG
jgi:tetratricopeptide (TPR) repeat protein